MPYNIVSAIFIQTRIWIAHPFTFPHTLNKAIKFNRDLGIIAEDAHLRVRWYYTLHFEEVS